MTEYRVTITKKLPDGKQVEIFWESGPGWLISPWLSRWAKKLYEPAPREEFEGQRELFSLGT